MDQRYLPQVFGVRWSDFVQNEEVWERTAQQPLNEVIKPLSAGSFYTFGFEGECGEHLQDNLVQPEDPQFQQTLKTEACMKTVLQLAKGREVFLVVHATKK